MDKTELKEKRKEVVLKLSKLFGLAVATKYEDLPKDVKDFYSHYRYTELLRPLVCFEYRKKEISMAVLARKYRISERQIRYMIKIGDNILNNKNKTEE